MDGLELNKISAAVLLALLIGMVSSMVSDKMIAPQMLEKNVYIVEGLEETQPLAAVGVAVKAVIESIGPLLASADIERGKIIAKKCVQCHTFDKGGPNRVGPNLWGIVGKDVAKVANFAYSRAMSELGGEWTFERLGRLLYKPRDLVRGTKMAFAGLLKAKDRADIVAYMNSMSDKPEALTSSGK